MASNWVDIQKNTFTRWCNEHLKDRGLQINDLQKDFNNGLVLINLLEIISGKSLGRYNKHPRVPYQKLENNGIALNFLKEEGIKLVNISGEDITEGRLKLILGLIWTLILRYHINKKGGEDTSAKSDLLKWIRSKIPDYNIQNFQRDWNDGRAICALVDALRPGLCPTHFSLDPKSNLDNATKGIDLAYDKLGVARLLLPSEMVHPKVDELAMMTYLSQFRDLPEKVEELDDASKCRAYGPGLVEGIVDQPAHFFIEMPSSCADKLKIKVEGPKSNAPVHLKKNDDGTWTCTYEPKEPGQYKVHVTLNDVHIPGSIFHVTVLEDLSLGGEGKIRVYYSTTSASDEKTRPLQEMLEAKGIHLRPEFEPWIPVDLMDPRDRDAVFQKAGTKILPIVYIDDKYIGDAKKLNDLNATGELDKLLQLNQGRFKELALKAQTHPGGAGPGGAGPGLKSGPKSPRLLNTDIGKGATISASAPPASTKPPGKTLDPNIGKHAAVK
eukprot:TRINITY_DN9187_c0_g1_i1.p1 TRINITY_DN9187_c0_g1~~TRINITY_DN9187_c0_g1_i1.p1  ORF type:complete len:497 (+),score=115.12 TRINITY_DN9187_c0_g1_i1:135-1625(+)